MMIKGLLYLLPMILQMAITQSIRTCLNGAGLTSMSQNYILYPTSRKPSAGSLKLRRVTLPRVLQWSGNTLVDKFDGQIFTNMISSTTLAMISFGEYRRVAPLASIRRCTTGKSDMQFAKSSPTPMESNLTLSKMIAPFQTPTEADYMKNIPYQEVVGALLYAACARRPEISAAVGKDQTHVFNCGHNGIIVDRNHHISELSTALCGLDTRIEDKRRLQPEYIARYIVSICDEAWSEYSYVSEALKKLMARFRATSLGRASQAVAIDVFFALLIHGYGIIDVAQTNGNQC
ncbi:hypothetical protein MIR68_003003 [Amoeboaphelidium protococcarum]|nr:hypothetical protein MIR68_003003 [Amoeboaphelidium protococcarum]